ncbi:MAG TPA: hypothetical protein VMC81_11230 [Rhodocyclaceae bacterium]|nr:hypothetical protein [Rhodocyclaceae bacterium]
MKREKMIEALIIDSMVQIFDRQRVRWLGDLLETGFRGFAHMSDGELRREMASRGLGLEAREDAGSHDDAGSAEVEHDPELQSLLHARLDTIDWHERAFEGS